MSSSSFEFLLIGKSGVGKTATSNSLLNIFESKITPGPYKVVVKSMESDDGTTVRTVDGLNVVEVEEKADFKDLENVMNDIGGFSAVLVILKFSDRYTEENTKVVQAAKGVFGVDVLQRFGICIFTNGDMFKRCVQSDDEEFKTFEEWLGQQTDGVKEVYENCQGRAVLFDNKTKVEQEKQEQRKNLLEEVFSIRNKSTIKYTLNELKDFAGRNETIQRKVEKDLMAKALQTVNDTRNRYVEMRKGALDANSLYNLIRELEKIKDDLENKLSGNNDVIIQVKSLLNEIQSLYKNVKSSASKNCEIVTLGNETVSKDKVFISIQVSSQLLSDIENEVNNLITIHEQFLDKFSEENHEMTTMAQKMKSGFCDLQSKLNELKTGGGLKVIRHTVEETSKRKDELTNSNCNLL